MKRYFARDALLPGGWAKDVCIEVGAGGDIEGVRFERAGEALAGPVLPGMANLHSHAFQRAMAGLAETRSEPQDDFWSWRELMYRFVERMTPGQAHAVALQLYIEMLKSGYTAVAEFHYVQHPGEMLGRHLAAARKAGIAITLMPSVYRWSGFGGKPLQRRQRRFDADVDNAVSLLEELKPSLSQDIKAGLSPHSLRAVDPESLRELARRFADGPIHIHAAEQTKEVDESLATLGKRPVEWLLENAGVDARWCLVHATHMSAEETRGLAQTGAVAGLCPSTEANLGDGIFPLLAYRAAGGRYGIGGDSHVCRDPAEELRLLEYAQRLTQRKRNLAVTDKTPAVGTTLWLEAAAGGAQALGRAMGAITPGKRADLVVLEGEHPDLAGRSGDEIAGSYVFGGTHGLVRDVMVAGAWRVREGRHELEKDAAAAYGAALRQLRA